jgi:hypothetical protein
MKTLSTGMFLFGMMMAIAAGGCVTSEADEGGNEDTETAAEASTVCREVRHYTYQYQGGVFRWDVTLELFSGREFVDERKIGGNPVFYRQYRVNPVWSYCPNGNEAVRLTSGTVVLNGTHVCLPDGREEYHGTDYQRLLVPSSPFVTYDCD